MLFIIAGYDTTSTTLCNILYCLALFPDHQQMVANEIEQQERKLNRQDFSYEDLNGFCYLDAVIYESLRYLPSVAR